MSNREHTPLTADDAVRMGQVDDVRLGAAKSHVFSLRLNDAEMKTFADGARAAGMKVGPFIKQAAMETLTAKTMWATYDAHIVTAPGISLTYMIRRDVLEPFPSTTGDDVDVRIPNYHGSYAIENA